MFERLIIENFIIIEQLELEFMPGLNVLTGETGAGKSIILQAIKVAMGERANSGMVRAGYNKALITALVTIETAELKKLLTDNGITCEEDDGLILQREISNNGKNFCRVNNCLVTLNLYRDICKGLVNFHSQNEQQSLFSPAKQLEILDCLGDESFIELKNILKDKYYCWRKISEQINKINKNIANNAMQKELLQFQAKELTDAALNPQIDNSISEQLKLLVNSEKIRNLGHGVYNILYSGTERQLSVCDLLNESSRKLTEMSQMDCRFSSLLVKIEDCRYQLEDTASEIADLYNSLDFDKQRLEIVEDRTDLLRKLKKKYQAGSVEELLVYLNKINEKLANWDQQKSDIEKLRQQQKLIAKEYRELSVKLHHNRQLLAQKLQQQLLNELKQLDIKEADFKVELAENIPTVNGMDNVAFLISFNRGEELKAIDKVASGGEISRFMLSIKTIITSVERYQTIVFDEIDTGVGGNALQTIVDKLILLSQSKQVICITHAPQIAASADNHIFVFKQVSESRTVTRTKQLKDEQRMREIARMLDGDNVTDISLSHAWQMVKKN